MDVLFAYNPGGFLHAVTCEQSAEQGAAFLTNMHAQGCRVERLTMAEYRLLRGLDRPAVEAPPLSPAEENALRLELWQRQWVASLHWAGHKRALAVLPPWAEIRNVIDDPLYSAHVHRWDAPAQDSAAGLAARRQLAAQLLFGRPLAHWGQRWVDLYQAAEAERARFRPPASPDAGPVSPTLPEIGADVLAPHIGLGTVVTHLTLADGVRVALVRGRYGEALARPDQWEAVPAPAAVAPAPPPPAPPADPPPAPTPRTVRPATTMPSLFGDWS